MRGLLGINICMLYPVLNSVSNSPYPLQNNNKSPNYNMEATKNKQYN